jgi:hypothetical protein
VIGLFLEVEYTIRENGPPRHGYVFFVFRLFLFFDIMPYPLYLKSFALENASSDSLFRFMALRAMPLLYQALAS